MASKENLIKRIESWNAKLEKEIAKLEMYDKRRDNALLRLSKAVGTNVTLDTYEDYARSNWDLYYPVVNAIDSKEDVEHRIKSIKQDIASLQYKLDAISNKEREYDQNLEDILKEHLADFKEQWFERMENYYHNLWKRLQSKRPFLEEEKKRLEAEVDSLGRWWTNNNYREYKKLSDQLSTVKQTLNHEAFRFDNAYDYYESKIDEIEDYYNSSIKKLVEKCYKFNIDRNNIKVLNPDVTDKGLEVIIKDGTNRYINARMIWAAEYSDYMVPHVRYIVTEKHV